MTPEKIIKRDGRKIKFRQEKITNAIFKAFMATGEGRKKDAKEISDTVVKKLEKSRRTPQVEEVQDLVEITLMSLGYYRTAKAYILYREQHKKIRDVVGLIHDVAVVEDYLEREDWMVRENSNMTYSLQGLNCYLSSRVVSHYWLQQIYPPNIRNAHTAGDFHIHDLGILGAYCVGWDLPDLLMRGIKGVSGKIESKPAKHFKSALGQMVNFLYTLQGEAAGAQAFSNVDTHLSPFIRYDGLNYDEVKQAMQEFIFNLNVPTRVGFQTPFVNFTLDLQVPEFMKDGVVIIGGELQSERFGDFQEEMNMFNRAFGEVMVGGDGKGRPFTFPIPTLNITKDFDWGERNYEPLWEMTAKYGIPYFSNFVNSDMSPDDVRSMCCRLRLDKRELKKRGGGLFGANPLTGCYDKKTEILTEDGWKFFKDLTKEDSVFTLTKNNKIELHNPKRLFEYNYEGEMYEFKTKSLDLVVTSNHRMVVDQVQSNKRKFVQAKDFDVNNQRIPKQGIWEGKEEKWFILPRIEFIKYGRQGRTSYPVVRDSLRIRMDNWLKFFGFWLAEGCTDNEKIAKRHGYRVVISQTNKKKKKEIRRVLDELPFNYYEEKDNLVICNKQLWTYLRQFGDTYTKCIPKEIKELSKRQLRLLFDWMVKGDGHLRKTTGQINYWTSSKKLADDLQEVILKLGWLGTSIPRKKENSQIKGRKIKSGIVYTLGVQKAKHYRLRKENIKKIDYKGKVFCCEVKNHTVFVRRNGKVCWSGNSIGVVTLNMPRLGYISKDEDEFFEGLERLLVLARSSLDIKRNVIENFTEKGLYPYSAVYLEGIKEGFGSYWKNHFSTIGLIGMNEALLNLMEVNIGSDEGGRFALKVLDYMRKRLSDFQSENGNIYNLEATPAEGCSYRLARLDLKEYPDIIVANSRDVRDKGVEPYYTNSTQLPVDYTDDIFEALRLQDELQTKYTGGTVFHGFMGEKMPSTESVKSLVRKITRNFSLPYFTITPTFSVCPEHGYLSGEHQKCPTCGRTCEVYSRSVGYLRPVSQWNEGKESEFRQRQTFDKQNPKKTR